MSSCEPDAWTRTEVKMGAANPHDDADVLVEENLCCNLACTVPGCQFLAVRRFFPRRSFLLTYIAPSNCWRPDTGTVIRGERGPSRIPIRGDALRSWKVRFLGSPLSYGERWQSYWHS